MQNISKSSLLNDDKLAERLVARMIDDRSVTRSDEGIDEKYARKLIKSILKNDPSPRNKYTAWVLRTYLKGGIRYTEDLSRTYHALARFDALKRTLPVGQRDINKFSDLATLEDTVEPLSDLEVGGKELRRQQAAKARSESNVLLEDENDLVVSPQTAEASIYWGRGTRWCTASSKSDNYFDYHHKKGPLYIIIADGVKYQLHISTDQFHDARDIPIQRPLPDNLVRALTNSGLVDILANLSPAEYVTYGLPFDETICLRALDKDSSTFRHMTNRTEVVVEAALQDPYNIRYIDTPTEEQIIGAVWKDCNVLRSIKKPTDELLLKIVQRVDGAIHNIKDEWQTLEICEAAVERSPGSLSGAKFQTLAMCEKAVDFWPLSLESAQFQTLEMCKKAVRFHPPNLKYAKHQTLEMCRTCVSDSAVFIEHAKFQDEEMAIAAVKHDGSLLQFVHEQTPAVVDAALKSKPSALQFVKNQTLTMCEGVIDRDYNQWVHARYISDTTKVRIIEDSWKNLKLLSDPTEECINRAIAQNGFALQWIVEPTDHQINAAISKSPYAIKLLDAPTEAQCRVALAQKPDAILLIPREFRTEEIMQIAMQSCGQDVLDLLQEENEATFEVENDISPSASPM